MQEINGYFTYQNLNRNERVALLKEYYRYQAQVSCGFWTAALLYGHSFVQGI